MPTRGSEKAVKASAGRKRHVVPRHRWTAAENALQRLREPFEAAVTKDGRAVVVTTGKRGARALQRFALDPAALVDLALDLVIEPPAPSAPAKAEEKTDPPEPPDPLDEAFARLRDQRRREIARS